ncbi:MAG: hypothetical protein UX73_C0008G0004 [candidate division WWE3 bacterium GW2011_GWC1_47_10]|uniref:Uncharacterized protein n=1 Tax=candidate division WWE3 bacterium GW2011_GWC1_47_10 TaxID=1619122 RepID=A0A0G1TA25_UNCKA|nr:MAG: hypothetical protein UX73_C0008G0004 [candidate division WWE3 bacterium GW2011_GWC1_47_10]
MILTLWWSSYLSLRPLIMAMVSCSDGSLTDIGWKRLSSAASFSMYFRYSSSVVAPTIWSSPRASAGFNIFAASIAPSAAPAPTTVCNSSRNKIICPCASTTSPIISFNLPSNWPRWPVPAKTDARSRENTRLFLSGSGTFPVTIFWASPSTMAVLPTPGSPINTGLFFVLRERMCTTRSISSFLPITGSSLSCFAKAVKSRPCLSSWEVAEVCFCSSL